MSALWTSSEAATATCGVAAGAWIANGVSIDTRTLAADDLFVALTGDARDGHEFVREAFAKGAAAAMVSRDVPGAEDARLLRVDDTLAGLGRLGVAARARARLLRAIALTGSVGKTGTKEMLRHALAGQAPTHASAASYNNHFGVPLTLARMPPETVFGVFEIGMNHAREIAPLAAMVLPEVAIVTTVEAVHTEFFADGIAGVARAKAEIFEAGGRVAILNRDNRFCAMLAAEARARGFSEIVTFGADPDADACLLDARIADAGTRVAAWIAGQRFDYTLGLIGRHWALDSLAVLAAVRAVGGDVARAAQSLATLKPPKGRGARHVATRGGATFTVIDDSYNASPPAMRAAFVVLAAATPGPGGRRVAVLGDMRELGTDAPRLHADLAEPLLAAADQVFACGPNMAALYERIPAARRGGYAVDAAGLLPAVLAAVRDGDIVLVKGSLGSRMGPIVAALLGETNRGAGAA